MVEHYIQSLLFEHDVVTLGELGSFEIYESPSEWDPVSNTILPFARKVKFNDKNKEDNGLLAQAIAEGEHISLEAAKQQIALYVHDIKTALKEENEFKFNELGTLYIDFHYELTLLPNPNLNFNKDTFGLPQISTDKPPILATTSEDTPPLSETEHGSEEKTETNEDWQTNHETIETSTDFSAIADTEKTPATPEASPTTTEPTEKPKKKLSITEHTHTESKKSTPVWAFILFIPILALVGIGIYSFISPEKSREIFGFMTLKNASKKMPADSTAAIDTTQSATPEVAAEEVPVPAPTPDLPPSYTPPAPNRTLNTANHNTSNTTVSTIPDAIPMKPNNPRRYLVIIGGATSLAEAQKIYKKAVSQGHTNAAITEPTATVNRYRISVGDYTTAAEAQQKQMEVLNVYKDAWIMLY